MRGVLLLCLLPCALGASLIFPRRPSYLFPTTSPTTTPTSAPNGLNASAKSNLTSKTTPTTKSTPTTKPTQLAKSVPTAKLTATTGRSVSVTRPVSVTIPSPPPVTGETLIASQPSSQRPLGPLYAPDTEKDIRTPSGLVFKRKSLADLIREHEKKGQKPEKEVPITHKPANPSSSIEEPERAASDSRTRREPKVITEPVEGQEYVQFHASSPDLRSETGQEQFQRGGIFDYEISSQGIDHNGEEPQESQFHEVFVEPDKVEENSEPSVRFQTEISVVTSAPKLFVGKVEIKPESLEGVIQDGHVQVSRKIEHVTSSEGVKMTKMAVELEPVSSKGFTKEPVLSEEGVLPMHVPDDAAHLMETDSKTKVNTTDDLVTHSDRVLDTTVEETSTPADSDYDLQELGSTWTRSTGTGAADETFETTISPDHHDRAGRTVLETMVTTHLTTVPKNLNRPVPQNLPHRKSETEQRGKWIPGEKPLSPSETTNTNTKIVVKEVNGQLYEYEYLYYDYDTDAPIEDFPDSTAAQPGRTTVGQTEPTEATPEENLVQPSSSPRTSEVHLANDERPRPPPIPSQAFPNPFFIPNAVPLENDGNSNRGRPNPANQSRSSFPFSAPTPFSPSRGQEGPLPNVRFDEPLSHEVHIPNDRLPSITRFPPRRKEPATFPPQHLSPFTPSQFPSSPSFPPFSTLAFSPPPFSQSQFPTSPVTPRPAFEDFHIPFQEAPPSLIHESVLSEATTEEAATTEEPTTIAFTTTTTTTTPIPPTTTTDGSRLRSRVRTRPSFRGGLRSTTETTEKEQDREPDSINELTEDKPRRFRPRTQAPITVNEILKPGNRSRVRGGVNPFAYRHRFRPSTSRFESDDGQPPEAAEGVSNSSHVPAGPTSTVAPPPITVRRKRPAQFDRSRFQNFRNQGTFRRGQTTTTEAAVEGTAEAQAHPSNGSDVSQDPLNEETEVTTPVSRRRQPNIFAQRARTRGRNPFFRIRGESTTETATSESSIPSTSAPQRSVTVEKPKSTKSEVPLANATEADPDANTTSGSLAILNRLRHRPTLQIRQPQRSESRSNATTDERRNRVSALLGRRRFPSSTTTEAIETEPVTTTTHPSLEEVATELPEHQEPEVLPALEPLVEPPRLLPPRRLPTVALPRQPALLEQPSAPRQLSPSEQPSITLPRRPGFSEQPSISLPRRPVFPEQPTITLPRRSAPQSESLRQPEQPSTERVPTESPVTTPELTPETESPDLGGNRRFSLFTRVRNREPGVLFIRRPS